MNIQMNQNKQKINNINLDRLVQNLPFLCYNFNDFIKGVDPNE